MSSRKYRVNKSAIIMAVPSVFFLLLSIFGFSSPVQATNACNTSYSAADFTRGGVATDSSGTITLTPNSGGQFGAIWNKSRVNLSSDFCVSAEVYLGTNDYGADGLAFVMQPNSVAAGSTGGGLGYAGITPSFAVEYDTYYNGGDLYNDHVGLMKNGNVVSHNLWSVSAVDVGNIEDSQWHKTKVYWDSTANTVSVWLDKNADGDLDDAGETLFNAVSANLESNFSGEVYWGFTAATGGATNLQQVRNIAYTGVARVNAPPTASTEPVLNNSIIINQATVIPFVVADDQTTQAQWSFTKTSSNTAVVPLNAIVVAMSSATNGTITITPATAGSSTVVIGIQDADGSALSYTLSVEATPPSLQVTSLLDNGSSGTLRWAINQANATAGGIYDAILITTQGTITLTSDLPAITAGVTITGTGMATTIIDGDNLWRAIYNSGSRTIVIQDMTFKQGKNVEWNGGLIYNSQGTLTFNDIKITAHSSWAFHQGGGGVTTFNDSQFTYNGVAISSDHGSTPSTLSQTDSDYSNRIYINNCTFSNNSYGISTERFTKITNSEFTNNAYGASLNGLNRQQVLDSTFSTNSTGVYLSSWIPTSWTPGAGNQTISGNVFNGNTNTAIDFANRFNNGNEIYNGVSANSWSTSSGNTFNSLSQNAANYAGSGYITSNDTITAPYFNAVQNLTAVANVDGSVTLTWSAPVASNLTPYMYAVNFSDLDPVGGGWGVWTLAANTTYTLSTGMFSGTNPVTTGYGAVKFTVYAGSSQCVGVGTGDCTYGAQSHVNAIVLDPTPPTTTTSSTTTTTSTTSTTVYVAPVDNTTTTVPYQPVPGPSDSGQSDNGGSDSLPTDTTEPPYIIPLPVTESTTATLPIETLPETEGTATTVLVLPEINEEDKEKEPETTSPNYNDGPADNDSNAILLPKNPDVDDISDAIEDVDFTEVTDKQFESTIDAVFDDLDNPEDVGTVLATFLDADISDTQLDAVLDKVFDGPMTADETTGILEKLLDGPVTVTQLETIMDKVFEDISDTKKTVAVLDKLFDGPLSDTQLETAMDSVFSEDATVAQMASVVTDLLDKDLDEKELDAVFDAAFDDDLSDKETIDLIVDVLKKDLTSEALGSALGAVFDEEVSTEVLVETFTAVLGTELNKESVGVIVGVLESETISSEQVSTVVTLITEQDGGVNSEQATELATSSKVLESIDGEQATEVFAAVIVSEVTEEAGAQIAEALAEAPVEVKESFEEEINVFAGVFDTYTALGSSIDVGTRRSVIAVNLVTSTAALASAAGAIPSPGSNSSPSTPKQDVAGRREEEEPEEGGAIEGEGPDWIKSISIYKYENGVKTMDWKNFTKKFIYGVMGSGFTLAGAAVMYFTLSGLTQQIALWGTLIAFACAMYLHMKDPD